MKLCMQCGINEKGYKSRICKPCAIANEAKQYEAFLAKNRAKTLANAIFRPCECGCGLTVRAPRRFATDCSIVRRKQTKHGAPYQPGRAKPETKEVRLQKAAMTDAQRDKLNKAQQLAGDVRVLTPEEIAAILPTIKPPSGTGKSRPKVDPDKDFYQFNSGSIEPRTLRPYSADKCRGS